MFGLKCGTGRYLGPGYVSGHAFHASVPGFVSASLALVGSGVGSPAVPVVPLSNTGGGGGGGGGGPPRAPRAPRPPGFPRWPPPPPRAPPPPPPVADPDVPSRRRVMSKARDSVMS